MAAIVDTGDLVQVVWVSFAAALGITLAYALAILGTARAVELGRSGRSAEAAVFAVLGALATLAVVAGVVAGVVVMVRG